MKLNSLIALLFLTLTLTLTLTTSWLHARNQIHAVGSSTVYPFVTIVAENFSNNSNNKFKTPVIESTGTGAGMKSFCSGLGEKTPDIVNASRKMKSSERDLCKKNGVNSIKEITLGLDAIVLIKPKSLNISSLTTDQIFLALAASVPDSVGNLIKNPYKTWKDVDKSLPATIIKVMGPPSTSGTRDSFLEMVFETSCKSMIEKGTIKLSANDNMKQVCSAIRRDKAWINGGENDVLLVRKVASSGDTMAILGYSYYEQNQKTVSAVSINGLAPTMANFSNSKYPLVRPLFVYIKEEHIGAIPGLSEFAMELASPKARGKNGYLTKAGLITSK